MKHYLNSFLILIFLVFTVNVTFSQAKPDLTIVTTAKAGEAGTWTYGSCYGDSGNCSVITNCDITGCTVSHIVYL